MEERGLTPINLPEEIDGDRDYTQIGKTMRSYLAGGDYGLCMGLIFPPMDKITPQGNIAILFDSSVMLPMGISIIDFIEETGIGGEKVDLNAVVEGADDRPIYLVTDGGSSYHYTLITVGSAGELLDGNEEYTLVE